MVAVSFSILALPMGLSAQGPATSRGRSVERINGRRAVSGEVLVRFRTPPSQQALTSLDLSEDERLLGGIRRMRARGGGALQLIGRLAARPDVLYVEPNYLLEPVALPRDPFYPLQSGFSNGSGGDVRVAGAWDTATGSRVGVIALLDTGVDVNHPDLADNIWSAPAPFTVTIAGHPVSCPVGTRGVDVMARTCDATDERGHGTAMAGIIGASGDNGIGVAGVNWTASILPVKFIDADGFGSYGDAIRALDVTIQVSRTFASSGGRIRVISASWRGTSPSQALADAVAAAGAEDMMVVAASGNDGIDIDAFPVYPAALDAPNVLAVAATNAADVREPYSNVGVTHVDLAAPGATYTTARGGAYAYVNGTSAAAAFVSGAVHLMLSRCAVDTAGVRWRVLDSVDHVDALNALVATSGRLNVDRLLSLCHAGNTPPMISIEPPARPFGPDEQIHLHADAWDADGRVTRVDYFVGSTWLAAANGAPWTLTSAAWPVGTYRITAVATDDAGATATSGVTTIAVAAAPFSSPGPWQQQDIGVPGAPGIVSGTSLALSVSGAGADVWGTADAFTFAYQLLSGNGAIVALVSSVEYVDAWTKAGVMLRESLAPDAAHAFMLASAGKGTAFQRRLMTGGSSVHTPGAHGGAPVWVRLARDGATITAATSVDGSTWTVVGTESVGWGNTIYAGVAVSSHRDGVLATATFDGVQLSSPAAAEPVEPPSAWSGVDVGAVGVAGGSSIYGDVFTVSGAGADVWGSADAFQFLHTSLSGDGAIVARVLSVDGSQSWTKAGVMIRGGLDAAAPHGFALVSVAKGAAFQRRSDAGGSSTHTSAGAWTAPLWVRLARAGSQVTAAVSPDGVSWTTIASDTIALGSTAYVGLAVSSHDPSLLATATFDSVSVIASGSMSAMPASWSSADVGRVGAPGDAQESSGVMTLLGAGADVWGTEDAFRYAYTTLAGDGSITARVAALDDVHPWTKAGLMVRASLDPGAAHGFVLVSAGKGLAFQRRPSDGGTTLHTGGELASAPQWLRLVRIGSLVTALTSPDGHAWSAIGGEMLDISGPVHVGLAVTSHDASRTATAVFTDVTVE
jgi:subtilisin family serine protease